MGKATTRLKCEKKAKIAHANHQKRTNEKIEQKSLHGIYVFCKDFS